MGWRCRFHGVHVFLQVDCVCDVEEVMEYASIMRSNIRIRGNIPVSLEATYEAVEYANTTRECTGEKRGD
jgi:hypothetical protein